MMNNDQKWYFKTIYKIQFFSLKKNILDERQVKSKNYDTVAELAILVPFL